ncbi:MAG: hypothetical protein KKG76_11470 [Euryarchaeota archaeon]|nr:hypothetical protein [Euryarchaeota archaeon]
MNINTRPEVTPKRPVHGWMGHAVGGVDTPWQLKRSHAHIETAWNAVKYIVDNYPGEFFLEQD